MSDAFLFILIRSGIWPECFTLAEDIKLWAFSLQNVILYQSGDMKRKLGFIVLSLIIFLSLGSVTSFAQCSICSRTTGQMGERPGKAFNVGIIYLAFTPLAIGGILGYRWWKQNR